MAATVISGRDVARSIKADVQRRVAELKDRGIVPGLAAILVGDHPASLVYVSLKEKDCAAVGIRSDTRHLPETATQADVMDAIATCNADPAIHGILLQHPLPAGLDEDAAVRAIDPAKDIDGVTPASFGELFAGAPCMVAPTALGALSLIKATGVSITGKRAAVLGRSKILGKPMAWLLVNENATVTICHSRTLDLAAVTREADIVVVGIDRPEFVGAEYIKPGAVVIDCGYNRRPDSAGDVGDVEYDAVLPIAGWISPVPGGVGPAGRAQLVANCVLAAEKAAGIVQAG